MTEQKEWLLDCLHRNAQTEYGLKYNFQAIRSLSDYRKQVPLTGYEALQVYIDAIAKGDKDILFAGLPVAFEVTGGSTGGKKLIPYTKESFTDFQRAILPWFVTTMQTYGLSGKNAYWAISPALRTEETSKGGIRIGVKDEEYLGEAFSAIAGSYTVPSWVGELKDISTWQLCTLYWLIKSKELELISVWSPTFLLMLLEALDDKKEELTMLFSVGSEIDGHLLGSDGQALMRLKDYIRIRDTASLWPELKLISCWADASSKPFFETLKRRFSHVQFQAKGLISTESVVTVPNQTGQPVLAKQSAFYEFIDETGIISLADDLCIGQKYEVVITTNGGLYRYKTGDIVLCEELGKEATVLRFQGRKGTVSDLVGEKLTEAFVSTSLQNVEGFCMLLASADHKPGYTLLLDADMTYDSEELRQEVEAQLCKNPQYDYARKMGQLKSLDTCSMKYPTKFYLDYRASKGSRMGDIKVPALCTDKDFYTMIKGMR